MIEVKNLVKKYGDVEAVRDVSFTIKPGMIYGFLGPNGAGKSTTMNIITGCLAATSGEVTVDGCDIYEDPVGAKSAIGYLPELPPLYTDMTPAEYLEFVGEAKGIRGDNLYREVERVIKKTGLEEYAGRLIKNLSKGYRQRVGIAQAIIGSPKVIILDEPTVGLDPRQIIEIRELIKELGQDHTVILSSHILTEISAVCDYVIIISRGRVVASDTLENLTKKYEGKNYVDLTFRGEREAGEKIIKSLPGALSAEYSTVNTGETQTVHAKIATSSDNDIREELFFRFADAKMPILSMEYEEVTLEKVFLELTSDSGAKNVTVPETSEEKYIDRVLDDLKKTDESTEAEEAQAEPEEIPAETQPENKKLTKSKEKTANDEYKPLFGGSDKEE